MWRMRLGQKKMEDEKRRASDDEEGSDGGSDSSSSSSSEEDLLSDEEEEEKALLHKLEASLAHNAYNFQDHVEYIRVLRRAGMLEKLREARDAMSSKFPLSPGMWQEWTSDEARLISSQEDVAAVGQLFERGLQEYLSVPLWLDYLEFNQQHDQDVVQCNSAGIAKMRGLYERALAAASLHFTEGSKLWAAFCQYECSLLLNLKDASEEAKAKQVICIRNIYRRQLSVPLCNWSTTFRDYVNWESQQGVQIGDDSDELAGLPANIAIAYKKAVQMCSLREPLEETISKDKPKDADLLQNFLSYIALEEETGDPARVQVLYERAVVEFPITHDLWLKYTSYLEKHLKVSAIILSVYGRAVWNCPWTQALWSRYLLALERSDSSESDMLKKFEQSLNSGFAFSTPEEYLDHYLTRVDGIRRRICGDQDEKSLYLKTLRETFSQAVELLSTYFPNFVDRSLRLHSYWARLEYSLANDMVAARGVWENLIKSSGWMVEAWKCYIAMEVSLGNLAEARTIYKRCYSRRLEGNGTEVLCEAWLCFEREHGSLEDYDRALMKVTPRLGEVKQLQQQQEVKFAAAVSRDLNQAGEKLAKKAVATGSGQKKRPLQGTDASKEKKSRKRPRISKADNDKEVTKEVSDNVQKDTKAEEDVTAGHEEPVVQAKLDSKQKKWYTDQCTAHVSQLAPEVNEDDLRELFHDCSLKEIRLMRDRKTGISRGFAYIDFDNEDGLVAALKFNNHKVKGSKLKVKRSDPPNKGGGRHGSRNEGDAGFHASTHDGKTDHTVDTKEKNENGEQVIEKRRNDFSQGRGRGGRFSSMPVTHRRGGHLQLTGKNTFAIPRSLVRPLGVSQRGQGQVTDEEPKSNDDFRKMLSKE